CSQLWDASAAIAAGKVGVRHVYGGRRRKSGRARCEVQGKLAKVQLARIVVLPAYEKPRRAIRGRRGAVVIGRKVSEFATGSHLAELGCGRAACQHFGTVESAEVGADEGLPILKNVVGSEVSAVAGGGPNAQLVIVVQIRAKRITVQRICAGRIVGLGHGNAFRNRGVGSDHGDEPAVGLAIVEYDGVAIGAVAAVAADRSE